MKIQFLNIALILSLLTVSAQESCYSSVALIPSGCVGGTIIEDSTSGCRTIICSEGGNHLRVLACDKPDSGAKQYFEMYKQSSAGTVPSICIGSTCISSNGYAKSTNFPYCMPSTEPQPQNQTPIPTPTPQPEPTPSDVQVSIAPHFPQGKNYVFKCSTSLFSPTSYDWNFGDGHIQRGMSSSDVWHTFSNNGAYAVQCTARDNNGNQAQGDLTVNVGLVQMGSATVQVIPGFPIDQNAVLSCSASGFSPTKYSWDFGDGTTAQTTNIPRNGQAFHIFQEDKTYTVTCTANNNEHYATGQAQVSIQSPRTEPSYWPYNVFQVYPQKLSAMTYRFSCDDVGFNGDIMWQFSNGTHTQEVVGRTIDHTFPSPGEWTAKCIGTGNNPQEHYHYYYPYSGNVNCQDGCIKEYKVYTIDVIAPARQILHDITVVIGETQTHTIAGRQYRIHLASLVDNDAQLFVNGHKLPIMHRGDIVDLQDGATIKVTRNGNVGSTSGTTLDLMATTRPCANSVGELPSSCTSTITEDSNGGCRTIYCAQSDNSIIVMACDKPDSGAKQYFEMYRVAYNGIPPKVCLGTSCIQNQGYVRGSNYPSCS